jgi:ribitol-5-phosphate 2-dehydrogenase
MIVQNYRLFRPRQIRTDFVDVPILPNEVLVRPTYLSICAADQRYYQGKRDAAVLAKKLPMALIHEAVGRVVYDPSGEFKVGDKVVMIPNTPVETDAVIKENYLRSSFFRSSGYDGFMRSIVNIERSRIIKYEGIDEKIASQLEMLSVAMNALEHFESYSHMKKQTIGVWGDGSVGFATALVLKKTFPNAKLIVFGNRYEKLHYFQFADELYQVSNVPDDVRVDHAFECVGGTKAENAINQIIDIINPQGSIALLGVSENNVPINTRMVLEKGLSILGNSRSGYEDFDAAIKFIQDNEDVPSYLSSIISDEIEVKSVKDMDRAFEEDSTNEFKTVMKWDI